MKRQIYYWGMGKVSEQRERVSEWKGDGRVSVERVSSQGGKRIQRGVGCRLGRGK